MNQTRIIEYGGKPHRCWLPGRWYRYTNNLKLGAVIECGCGKRYELAYWNGGYWWDEER